MGKHDFREDLPKGHGGEEVFHKMQRGFLDRTDGKEGDFTLRTSKKEVVELKTEVSYSAGDPQAEQALEFREAMGIPTPRDGWRQTDNLFVERYSSKEAKSPGGPWQAQKHGAEYYVHLFLGDGAFFVYRTDDMVGFMEENKHEYRLRDVRNQGYTTAGYTVPRADVARLEIHDLFSAAAADEAAR
jgi:hypothetical protein